MTIEQKLNHLRIAKDEINNALSNGDSDEFLHSALDLIDQHINIVLGGNKYND